MNDVSEVVIRDRVEGAGTEQAWLWDLTAIPWVHRVLRWRPLQFALTTFTLAFFVLAIVAGFVGTPVGNRNFAIVFVWIVWWALLIIVLVPLGGRLWCAICPIPAPGEWLQRRALVSPAGRVLHTLGWRWPRRLRSIWLQNASFLAMAIFSALVLTDPRVTAWVLLGLVLVAVALSLTYERRIFCRFVCPVGGFIGLYSLMAPVELRVKDPAVCRGHREKACYLGNERGVGCPWLVFPGALRRNAYCGLCTECLKTCTLDNVAFRVRPPGRDLLVADERRLDEAYKALIMVTCALLYAAVYLGPWGWLKDIAAGNPWTWWLGYALIFLLTNLALVPGAFLVFAWASRRWAKATTIPLRRWFVDMAYVLVPFGLAAWIAFSLSFVLANASYALPVLSDPLGWGWDLLGTADIPWTPLLTGITPYLQILVLAGGMTLATWAAWEIAGQHVAEPARRARAALPVLLFVLALNQGLLRLLMG